MDEMQKIMLVLVQAVLVLVSVLWHGSVAEAQQGEWRLGARMISLQLDSSSDTLSNGSGLAADTSSPLSLELDLTHMLYDDWSLELDLAATRLDLETRGGTADGVAAGKAWFTPMTLTLQYHLLMGREWQPYVGGGLVLAGFLDSEVSDAMVAAGTSSIDLDTEVGYAGRIGVAYALRDRWSLCVDLKYMDVSTQAELRYAADDPSESIDLDLSGWSVGLGAGFWFN